MENLRQELKQSRPFRNLNEETILNVWRTGDFVAAKLQRLLKTQGGISQTQYNVLRILRGSGRGGLPCGEIAGRMLTRDPDVTRLMDRLVRQRLARRAREHQDRRVIRARITPAGVRLLAELEAPVNKLIDQTLGHMKKSELRTLIALLSGVRRGAQASG